MFLSELILLFSTTSVTKKPGLGRTTRNCLQIYSPREFSIKTFIYVSKFFFFSKDYFIIVVINVIFGKTSLIFFPLLLEIKSRFSVWYKSRKGIS